MNIFKVIMKLLVVPKDISKDALLTIVPCLLVGIYIAIVIKYNFLCLLYGLLLITSCLYWTNTNWKNMMYLDITIVAILIILKSFIVTNRFNNIYKLLWFFALCIMIISFIVNRAILMRRLYPSNTIERNVIGDIIDKYYPITYTPEGTHERRKAYQTSTRIHMVMIHLLPTIIFATGFYISCMK